MSFAPESDSPTAAALAKPEALLRVPVGLASPLWGFFAGAAVSGATWWWMTRWARTENLEAMFAGPVLEVAETAEALIEAAAEPPLEVAAEATPEPVLEALVDATPELQPVGGESAPISPVVEALAPEIVEPPLEPAESATKPKKKTAAAAAGDIAAH